MTNDSYFPVLPEFSFSPRNGSLNMETCNVTGRKLIEVRPNFECAFKFDVVWLEESCRTLVGLSNDGSSVLGSVKKCKKASCQFHLMARSECSKNVLESQYMIHIPGDAAIADSCQGIALFCPLKTQFHVLIIVITEE